MAEPHPLQRLIDEGPGKVLVVHDARCSALASALDGPQLTRVDTRRLQTVRARRRRLVILAVADESALRRTVSLLPRIGRTNVVACWLDEAAAPALLTPRPEWPPITTLEARHLETGAALTVVHLSEQHLANSVLEQLARAAGPRTVAGSHGLVVATTRPDPDTAPPADPSFRVLEMAEAGSDPDVDVPPDVVLVGPGGGAVSSHHVIGRPPTVVSLPDPIGGPLDEGVLNPRGYRREPAKGLVRLGVGADGRLEADGPDLQTVLDPGRGATRAHVAELRNHIGVHVNWSAEAPAATARVVAGLAMAGVPLVTDRLPDGAAELLGPRLNRALTEPTDLTVALLRDEHSVRLRRAALLEHSTLAWRARLAGAAGLPESVLPTCSVVLATRRPQQLEFLLRQVAKQRGSEVELVVAAHGFEPDRAVVQRLLGDRALVLVLPEATRFGDVLNAAAQAASGDLLLKMDDDDWYGPDVVTDLLLARHYSGADLVGMATEYVYIESLQRTIRRTDDAERAAKYVAGGTMLFDRALLLEAGGFRPVHRYVDAQLLAAVESMGASIYRTHGLGYLYRRAATGHTWDPGLDFFLNEDRVAEQWEGFVPSKLLEYDPEEAPRPVV
jgi:hypothetical protein